MTIVALIRISRMLDQAQSSWIEALDNTKVALKIAKTWQDAYNDLLDKTRSKNNVVNN